MRRPDEANQKLVPERLHYPHLGTIKVYSALFGEVEFISEVFNVAFLVSVGRRGYRRAIWSRCGLRFLNNSE